VKKDLKKHTLTEVNYDIDWSLLHVKSLHELDTFTSIQQLLAKSTEIAQQLTKDQQQPARRNSMTPNQVPPSKLPMSPTNTQMTSPISEPSQDDPQTSVPTTPPATLTSFDQELKAKSTTAFSLRPKQF